MGKSHCNLFHLLVLTTFLHSAAVLSLEADFDHDMSWITSSRPLVIAHRGASGIYPEHTAPAYQEGIDQGADLIECDVVISKDLVPLCLHDNYLSPISNITEVFPNCSETLHITDEGVNVTDCFAHRFTLSELRTVGIKQRFPETRDTQYDYKYTVVTLEEFLEIAKSAGRTVGVYPELKNPVFVNSLDIWQGSNTSFEDIFLDTIHNAGYKTPDDPCIIQCFDYDSLLYMKSRTELPCVPAVRDPVSDSDLDKFQEDGFYGIAILKDYVVPDLVDKAHDRGLKVHAATFRNDQLDFQFQADIYNEYLEFAEKGLDASFADYPSTSGRALELIYPSGLCGAGSTQHPPPSNAVLFLVALILFLKV